MQKNLKGFTLVEVLIVIIIVGILIAALLPRLVGSQARARDNARSAMVNQIANGVALLLNDVGTLSHGDTGYTCFNALDVLSGSNGEDLGDYLASLPEDPQSTHSNAPTGMGTCAGNAWGYASGGGGFVFVYADYEGTNGANTASPAITTDTIAEYQALLTAGGTAGFGVLIR